MQHKQKDLSLHKQQIIEMYSRGNSLKSIGKIFNCYPDTIGKLLKNNGIVIRTKGICKGSVSWNKGKTFYLQSTINLIKSGNYKHLCEQAIRKHIKRVLIYEQGNKCSICGVTEWCGKSVPLVCDHIDGNSSNCDLSNFRIVCCNCDAQLPTFKSKNRGKGRICNRNYMRANK